METLRDIWAFLFNRKKVCGKQWIEESMTEKYGPNWFEEMVEGLRDPEVRKSLADHLGLKK